MQLNTWHYLLHYRPCLLNGPVQAGKRSPGGVGCKLVTFALKELS